MYTLFNKQSKKVYGEPLNEKPISYTDDLELAEVVSLPPKERNQYYIVDCVREQVRVLKEAWDEPIEEYDENGELKTDLKVKHHEAITETYVTCDLVVNDRPPITLTKEQIHAKYESLVEKYIREKYTLSQELAILRQRDSKPEEFADYNAYAEQCKAQAKQQLYN